MAAQKMYLFVTTADGAKISRFQGKIFTNRMVNLNQLDLPLIRNISLIILSLMLNYY